MTAVGAFGYWTGRIGRRFGGGRRTSRDELADPELMAGICIAAQDELRRHHCPSQPQTYLAFLLTLLALDYSPEVAIASAMNAICANDDAVTWL